MGPRKDDARDHENGDKARIGVDGCKGGWLAVVDSRGELASCVYPNWAALMAEVGRSAVIAVDIPIGLPSRGSRACDLEARQFLGRPRGSSVFPAPVLTCCLRHGSYVQLCALHQRVDERSLSRQAFHILPKIRDVDAYLLEHPRDRARVREIHPEVSFAVWNDSRAMTHRKSKPEGRTERERLIDAAWPRARARLWCELRGSHCRRDDLNDAFAALWTARRIAAGTAVQMPAIVEKDPRGLRMCIVA